MKTLPTISIYMFLTSYAFLAQAADSAQPARSKRVWSNEDFPSRTTETAPEVTPAAVAPAPKPVVETKAKVDVPESPEIQKARQEVIDEMLATAKKREKAYDETIHDVNAKLEKETNTFRIEVYKNILRDTQALKEVNAQVQKQFGGKTEEIQETTKN